MENSMSKVQQWMDRETFVDAVFPSKEQAISVWMPPHQSRLLGAMDQCGYLTLSDGEEQHTVTLDRLAAINLTQWLVDKFNLTVDARIVEQRVVTVE
jgi:hypothetical protein